VKEIIGTVQISHILAEQCRLKVKAHMFKLNAMIYRIMKFIEALRAMRGVYF